MSRYTITFTSNDRSDPDAVIGYDPRLRTLFLHAFSDETGDNLAFAPQIEDDKQVEPLKRLGR